MRQNLNCTRVSLFAIALSLAAFLPWAGDPAVAATGVAELLADQPAESLAAKLQPAEVPAAEGIDHRTFGAEGRGSRHGLGGDHRVERPTDARLETCRRTDHRAMGVPRRGPRRRRLLRH